jgi:hypothetical protein
MFSNSTIILDIAREFILTLIRSTDPQPTGNNFAAAHLQPGTHNNDADAGGGGADPGDASDALRKRVLASKCLKRIIAH